MKKELKSVILSADKSADGRPTVFWVNVIAVLVLINVSKGRTTTTCVFCFSAMVRKQPHRQGIK